VAQHPDGVLRRLLVAHAADDTSELGVRRGAEALEEEDELGGSGASKESRSPLAGCAKARRRVQGGPVERGDGLAAAARRDEGVRVPP